MKIEEMCLHSNKNKILENETKLKTVQDKLNFD